MLVVAVVEEVLYVAAIAAANLESGIVKDWLQCDVRDTSQIQMEGREVVVDP